MSIATDKARLESAKSNLASWISAKGVSVPSGAKIDSLVSLLDNVPSGGTTVQEYSGTFRTDANGGATVNIGFKPDIVTIISPDPIPTVGGQGSVSAVFDFTIMRTGDVLSVVNFRSNESNVLYYEGFAHTSNNGFIVDYLGYVTNSWQYLSLPNATITFKAVKYS